MGQIKLTGLPKKGQHLALDQTITFGAVAVIPDLPTSNTGEVKTPWVAVPQDGDTMEYYVDWTQHLNTSVYVTIAVEYRTAGDDKTLRELGSDSRFGGVVYGDHGEPAPGLLVSQSIPEPTRADREMRVKIICKDGSFSTLGGYFVFKKTATAKPV